MVVKSIQLYILCLSLNAAGEGTLASIDPLCSQSKREGYGPGRRYQLQFIVSKPRLTTSEALINDDDRVKATMRYTYAIKSRYSRLRPIAACALRVGSDYIHLNTDFC
jgi:hypothetical protein